MQYNTQTDPNWKHNSMAQSNDCLNNIGSLVTCLANVQQLITGEEWTPSDMNQFCIDHQIYNGLFFPGSDKTTYSLILPKEFNYHCAYFRMNTTFKLLKCCSTIYIIKLWQGFPYHEYGNVIHVGEKLVWYFDPVLGIIKIIEPRRILRMIECMKKVS